MSAAESEYFSNLISHDEPFAALLRSHPEICVVGRPVVLDRADAEMLREYFTERLATIGFDAASNLLVTQAKAYLANPTAGTLAQIQTQVVTFQQQVNAAILQAARIVNTASQKHALAAVQAVGTIVNAILALVQSISSKAAVAQMAAQSTIKLAAVEPYLDRSQATQMVAEHYGEPLAVARIELAQAERLQLSAGF